MNKRQLVAAVTASGAILCLTFSAESRGIDEGSARSSTSMKPLPLRVEEMREKLRAAVPKSEDPASEKQIENVVQFFNFFNCFRPGWRNC